MTAAQRAVTPAWTTRIALLATLASSCYLIITGASLEGADRQFGPVEFGLRDGRWVFIIAGIIGLLSVVFHDSDALKLAWLIAFTIAAVGRTATLVIVGVPGLSRAYELRGALFWFGYWLANVACVFFVLVARAIRTRQ